MDFGLGLVNYGTYIGNFFCLDVVMDYLSKKLDGKSLSEKISFIWTEWTHRYDFLDIPNTGAFAFRFILLGLR